MICPHCGAPTGMTSLGAPAAFCPACGAAIGAPAEVICPRCGYHSPASAWFCMRCGGSMRAGVPPAVARRGKRARSTRPGRAAWLLLLPALAALAALLWRALQGGSLPF